MAGTSSRTLQLLSLLQNHRHWPGPELAARLGVSARTLRRDVDRLRELGYPVASQRGADGGYQLAPGAALPPLVLDDDESVALVVALHAAVQSSVAGVAESSVRALAKVVQVMPARLRRQAEALRAMTVPAPWTTDDAAVDPRVLTAVAQACRDDEILELAYTTREGARSDRRLEPHQLVLLGRRWYLVAWDLGRFDWRSFRVDRIEAPRATRDRFHRRELPVPDAAAFVRAGIEAQAGGYDVEVVVEAPADLVRARIGRWATVEPTGDAECRVRMTSDSLEWPAFALGVVAAPFTIVEPAELVVQVRHWGRRFSAATAPIG